MADTLKQQIQDDMKAAMRAQQKLKLTTIRMLLAAMKQREIDEKITLDDPAILSIINKMIKQRRESIKQFEAANRQELADKEQAEIDILTDYLPQALSEQEITQAIAAAIANTQASSIKDMGKVMAILKPQLAGCADMGAVSAKVKSQLS